MELCCRAVLAAICVRAFLFLILIGLSVASGPLHHLFLFWDSLPLGLILETTFSRKSSMTCTEMEPSSMPEQNPLLG